MSTSIKKSDYDHKNPREVTLFCGRGVSTSFPGTDTFTPTVPIPSSARIAQVTVDTRHRMKPVIEIEFSSIVSFLAAGSDAKASLSFLLYRNCDDEEPVVVNSWSYEVFELENTTIRERLSTSFAFNFCECLNDGDCCEYFVEAFVGGLQQSSVQINNVHITALAG
ncbi:DUF4489 domain-containing protein [Vallitalea okinawensis]|uniref:DUF4489 domain-containing protein n=1 Tax=Vallitalea okinawensis TaxID=2078660 RepID=UPI000CFC4E8B|nr:DUF4489 domain-containing protein [Vallitalea okinawensis]